MLEEIKDLWLFRGVLWNLILQQLKIRYRRSVLGFLWTLLNPLLSMVILTIVFANIMKFPQKDYALYLFSGLVPWTFFSQSIELGKSIFIMNEQFLRRIYVPKNIFPLSVVFSNLVNFLLSLLVLFILGKLFFDIKISSALLFLPFSILTLIIFTCAVAIVFSVLSVFYRDFAHLTGILLMLLFYATPIIYPADLLPEKYALILRLNPMYYIMDLFHRPIFFHTLPSLENIMIAFIFSVAAFVVSFGFLSINRYNVVYRL